MLASGGLLIALGTVGESRQWRHFRVLARNLPASDKFTVCPNPFANAIYRIGTKLTQPFLFELDVATKLVNPTPGSIYSTPKEKRWRVLNRVGLFTLVIPIIAGVMATLGFCFRAVGAAFRPPVSLLRNKSLPFKQVSPGDSIHIRTYNTGLMPPVINNLNNLRSPNTRAFHIGHSSSGPDVICFQEGFDLRATSTLCEELSHHFALVIHSVVPRETGMGSGLIIATNFRVEAVSFTAFSSRGGEDALANKGVLGVTLKFDDKRNIQLFNTHLQAKEGRKYDEIRVKQVEQLAAIAKQDSDCVATVVAGDLNISPYNSKGELNARFYQAKGLLKGFTNVYDLDHHPDGRRKKDLSAIESKSSWYSQSKESGWGTTDWKQATGPTGYILDHIFVAPRAAALSSTSQIENPKYWGAQSGHSDHLPFSCHVTL
ncbi:MAG: hypothetical protein K1000chlam4_00286 [Chlamydiae bacterium]|nr:hypothetical protein [Chlamydiota bacterium]